MVGTLGPGVGVGKAARFRYVATASQTTFSGADASPQALTLQYTPGYVEVVVNGIWLTPDEYTATSGSSIVFPNGLAAGDVVYVYVLSVMSVANTFDKTQNLADILSAATARANIGAQAIITTASNILGADVALNNTANYFTGPTVSQGTSGTWFASGSVTFLDPSLAVFFAKLWDGTTVIASSVQWATTNQPFSIHLAGVISSPAGNIRIDVRDSTNITGAIKFNVSGNSKDSNLTVVRIA